MKRDATTTLHTRRLSNAFGIEILGQNLQDTLSDEAIAEVRRLWNENGIVLLRGQDITPQQLIDYSRRFGALDQHETLVPFRHPEHPELFVLSTIPVNGKPSRIGTSGNPRTSSCGITAAPCTSRSRTLHRTRIVIACAPRYSANRAATS